jgi:hypothetical protein
MNTEPNFKNTSDDDLQWYIANASPWAHGELIVNLCKELLKERNKRKEEFWFEKNQPKKELR